MFNEVKVKFIMYQWISDISIPKKETKREMPIQMTRIEQPNPPPRPKPDNIILAHGVNEFTSVLPEALKKKKVEQKPSPPPIAKKEMPKQQVPPPNTKHIILNSTLGVFSSALLNARNEEFLKQAEFRPKSLDNYESLKAYC
jgi:hypothetical protein